MFIHDDENIILSNSIKKKNRKDQQFDELDDDLMEEIQTTLIQFQECTSKEDFDFLLTPLLMLLEILDNNNDNKDIIPQILEKFEELFPFFFELITNFQSNSDFYHQLIDVIANITCYLDYEKYKNYISTQFFNSLFNILANDFDLLEIITVLSNIFSEVDFQCQNFILHQFSLLIDKFPNEKNIQRKIYRFFYITIKYIQKIEEDFLPYINKFIDQFIISFSEYNPKFYFSYYFAFFAFGNLIKRGVDINLFMQPELISIYNMCLHSSLEKVLFGDFFILYNIVYRINDYDFSKLFDYKQAIEVIFNINQIINSETSKLNDDIILYGLNFLICSAADSSQMQEYLFSLDIFTYIEQLHASSSYKIRSELIYLYITLIPRENYKMRIDLLETPFFVNSILSLVDTYDKRTQKKILEIIYFTLLKCDTEEDKIYHNFLIENGFITIAERISFEDEKLTLYFNNILNMLQD